MNQKLLKQVGMAPGVPGFEHAIQAIATEVLTGCCDEVRKDYIGNVIGIRKATGKVAKGKRVPRLMLAAHCDEVGMMVKHIHGNGYIHFIQMGGLGPNVAQSQRVIIHGNKQAVRGVIVPQRRRYPPETGRFADRHRPFQG
jgi:putative aminopeptidase FrvX